MIFGAFFVINAIEAQRAAAKQLEAAQEAQYLQLQFASYRTQGLLNLAQLQLRAKLQSKVPQWSCNCRNCGAPFEPGDTQCSYCRSER